MVTALSFAQKVTKENLQGTWQIVAIDILNTEGVYIDLVKDEVTFSDAIKSQATNEILEQVRSEFAPAIPVFKQVTMIVNNNEFTQSMPGQAEKGSYTFSEEGTVQFMLLNFENGTNDKVKISFKENLLYIDTSTDGIFVYKKA